MKYLFILQFIIINIQCIIEIFFIKLGTYLISETTENLLLVKVFVGKIKFDKNYLNEISIRISNSTITIEHVCVFKQIVF